MPMTIAEQMLYTTVKITTSHGGAVSGTGTGFFYNIQIDGSSQAPCLITNKHVVEGADQIILMCHLAKDQEPSGEFIRLTLAIGQDGILYHPDSSVDLCAIPLASILEQAKSSGKAIFYVATEPALIPDDTGWDNFDAIEEVLMVGCPRGIYDEANNLPIVRRGITASALNKRYNGKDEFLVDMACFPGSSGSPVFINNRDGFLDRSRKTFMMGLTRFNLLGILYSGPLIKANGQIVMAQPPSVEVATMMHLGNVIRATQLAALEKLILGLAAQQRQSRPTFYNGE